MAILQYSIILLLFVIPMAKSDCQREFDNVCFDDLSAINTNCLLFSDNDVNITEPIGKDGYISVMFDLKLYCNITEYEIILFINEDIKSETACRTNENFKKVHTTIVYTRLANKKSKMPVCGKTATVTFQYVYTGCYKFRFQAKLVDASYTKHEKVEKSMPVIKNKYIQTAYNKTLIQKPEVFADYREEDEPDDHLMILQIKSPLLMCNTTIGLEFKCKHNCSGDSKTLRRYSIYCVLPHMKEHSECEVAGNSSNISCFMKNESVGSIECQVKNITRGNYSFAVVIDDDIRCASSTVWGGVNTCEWIFDKEIKEQELATTASDTSRAEETEVYLYLSILVFVVIVLVAAALILHKIRQKSKAQLALLMHHVENGENRLIESPKILLLYARDDERLMNTMVAFRDMLKQVCKSEVYDIYDPRFEEEIAPDPEEWIREKLSHESCKTVLILTKCGYLLSKQIAPSTYVYQHQQCYDTLFPYAMKILTHNLNCVSYTKLFVVNLNFDRNDYESFEFFNPYTRYRLPDNVVKLLSDLIDKQVHDAEVQDATVYKQFLHEYNTLQAYQITHSNNIENVLSVEPANV